MRILLILLIAGLCLVTAKYIPHDLSDANTALHRVRRSDSQDSDSNTASVERDDDSSNNDNDDSDDNDSAEKIVNEEQNKLREKEEKKKQKLLEKQEKERQKEIEEQRKLEEKLAKEQRKEAEKREKEQRKLQEKIEKERQKLEEEKRKEEQKLEKEERKRQEKLHKQLEKLQKEQKESAEDTYLETEEEDSVEIEDIWKAHVYDKYGISITSNKLERQAALQRYLQEELGIAPNSTKSERRQAILKLIQAKLQNDTAAVTSFRNLLLSHVNAAQIQKLKSKLDKDLEELNNQTQLLNNVSLPWASVAQQNIEEKRTFLQAIAQFLSNIVPNWFTGGQPLSNSTGLNENEVPIISVTPADSAIPNDISSSGNLPQSVATNDNASLGDGENNLSVIPSDTGSGSSSNNPSESNGTLGTVSLNNNIPVDQSNANQISSNNDVPSNIDNSANSNSINVPVAAIPEITSSNPSESNGSIGSDSVNTISVNQISIDELSGTVDSSSLSLPIPADSGLDSGNESTVAGSSSSYIPDSQTDINGQSYNTNQLSNNDSLSQSASVNSVPTSSNAQETNGPAASDSVNTDIPINHISANELPSSTIDVAISDLTNTATSIDALGNPSVSEVNAPSPSESNGAVDSNIDNTNNVGSSDIGNVLPSNIGTSSIPVLPDEGFSTTAGESTSNLTKPGESNDNGSVNTEQSGATIDDVSTANSNLLDVISFAQSTESSVTDLLPSNVTSQTDASEGNVETAPTSVDLDPSTVSTDFLNSSGNDNSINNSASGQNEVINVADPALITVSESSNASSDVISSTGSTQLSGDSSVTSEPSNNVPTDNAVTSDALDEINNTPVHSDAANTNETLISENVATENVVNANETASTNNSDGVSITTDGTVQVIDGISIDSDNTVSTVIDEINDSGTSTLIASTDAESVTSNVEAVTDVITLSTQEDPSPIAVDGSALASEAGINVENANSEGHIADSPTPSLVETKDITQIEAQTEQGNFLVQEIVNTPSDLVTIASDQASSPLPPDIILPVEEAASIVDIKEQQ